MAPKENLSVPNRSLEFQKDQNGQMKIKRDLKGPIVEANGRKGTIRDPYGLKLF